ncbi:MAG: ABC transporter substrate-binding protein [Lactobacillus sp.]|nr:ABC transporter substrate-binding protein [Lactobacillus sp.]MCI2032848.1 ABC transporter substrate-binding protein [Lactobacillus sp.]
MFKKSVLIAVALVSLGLAAQPVNAATKTHTVTDMAGDKVKVPTKVTKVADLWHASNPIVVMLGGADTIVATTQLIHDNALLTSLYPSLKRQAVPFAGSDVQIETLLKADPDVVISSSPAQVTTLRKAKLPTINAMFQTLPDMRKSITLTANVLNTKAAKAEAKAYNAQFKKDVQSVKDKTAAAKTTPSVLHVVGLADLTKVDGTKTIPDEWIKIAGGQNAITEAGNMLTVTPEAIVKADPDVIIVGSTTSAKALAAFQKDSRFKHLTAVKNKRVYGNPIGLFAWDRYSAEADLQIWWAAKKLHPELTKDVNMTTKAKAFYQKFFGQQLTTSQIKTILAGEVAK